MKQLNKTVLTLLLLVSAYFATGQTSKIEIPEPDYIGNVVYIESGKSTLLEKQKPTFETKGAAAAAFGVGKAKGYYVLKGLNSPMRIAENDSLKFIVKVENNNLDPYQLIHVFKLEQNNDKKTRSLNVANVKASGKTEKDIVTFLEFRAKKYGETSYLIEMNSKLTSGEYSITYNKGTGSDFCYLFGID